MVAAVAEAMRRRRDRVLPKDLIEFVHHFDSSYQDGAIHRLLAKKIEQALAKRCVYCDKSREDCRGGDHEFRPLNRLMVFTPPQVGKSRMLSVMAPAHYLATHPEKYWVAASYAETLAARNSRH